MTQLGIDICSIDHRLGRWQDALADVGEVDALIADPPYSARTHSGQRTGSSIRMPTIAYAPITENDCHELARSWAPRVRNWVVLLCDHRAHLWHEDAWQAQGWCTFAPVFMKENPTPRFSGDGPAFGLEFMMVARRRARSVRPMGSFPSRYEFQIGGDRRTRTVSGGAKPVALMRAIIRDYTLAGDLIVDTHSGGGTTAVAARKEGRRIVCSEMDPQTFADAEARFAGRRPERFVDNMPADADHALALFKEIA